MNWEEACQILGVAPTATPAEIKTQYLYKAQLLHPDKTAGYPEAVRQKAEEELKRINAAYAVLKDAKNNTAGVPPRLRVSPKRIRFADVPPGQRKTTVVKIENVGGAYTKFWMDDAPAAWLKVIEVRSISGDPLPLEATIEAAGGEAPHKQLECSLPIRIENEKNKTRDEVSVRIQLAETKRQSKREFKLKWPLKSESPALTPGLQALVLISALCAAGLVIAAFIKSLIPFWVLAGFSVLFVVERWFGNPDRKHKIAGIFYRLILNLGILAYLGFVIWCAVQLFSQHFMRSPLIGSLVFLGECAALAWGWVTLRKNSWRFPSMKLTVGAMIVALAVFAFAGVQPFAKYKDEAFSRVYTYLTAQGS